MTQQKVFFRLFPYRDRVRLELVSSDPSESGKAAVTINFTAREARQFAANVMNSSLMAESGDPAITDPPQE